MSALTSSRRKWRRCRDRFPFADDAADAAVAGAANDAAEGSFVSRDDGATGIAFRRVAEEEDEEEEEDYNDYPANSIDNVDENASDGTVSERHSRRDVYANHSSPTGEHSPSGDLSSPGFTAAASTTTTTTNATAAAASVRTTPRLELNPNRSYLKGDKFEIVLLDK